MNVLPEVKEVKIKKLKRKQYLLRIIGGGIMPYNENDNIRVQKPLVPLKIKRKLQEGEIRLPSGNIMKTKQVQISQKNTEPQVLAQKRKQLQTYRNKQWKQAEMEAHTIEGLTAPLQFISPSHIIGSATSNKPFAEAYIGEYNSPTNNTAADFLLDASIGGGLKSAVKLIGLSKNIAGNLINNYKDVRALNNFIKKYDYSAIQPKMSLIFNDKKLDDTFDYIVKRHNTFARGVDPYETQQFGRLTNLPPEKAAEYSLTHIPKVYKGNNAGLLPNENGLYLSNSFNTAAGYTNQGKGYVGVVRRPIKYGQTTRRDFLQENDFIFNRPPGTQKRFYTTTDDPNNAWIYRNYRGFNRHKKIKDKEVNWQQSQPYEIRANAGARISEWNKDPNYRHYIIVGEEGQQPVELIRMYKPKIIGSKAHDNISSVSLSRKK